MKIYSFVFLISTSLAITGCFGPTTFDATDEESIKKSTRAMAAELVDDDRDMLKKAIAYYSISPDWAAGLKLNEFPSVDVVVNLQEINGLTSSQIIEKYKLDYAKAVAEKAERQRRADEVIALSDKARELLEENKFKDALDAYDQMKEISDGGAVLATEGIKNVTASMSIFQAKQEYLPKVEIISFVAERINTYSDKNVPAVRVGLKNNGDRSLDKVEVVVYFQDKDGNVIHEEDMRPVFVNKYSYDAKPLKAGYTYEQETGKYRVIDNPMTQWDEGKAFVKVTDIEFTP
jgi:hypothetical protein